MDVQEYQNGKILVKKKMYVLNALSVRHSESDSYRLMIPDTGIDFSFESNSKAYIITSATTVDSSGSFYFSMWGNLYKYEKNKLSLIWKFESRILHLDLKEDRIWVGLSKDGFKVLNTKTKAIEIEEKLDHHSVSDILVNDKEQVWLTTLENGVYFLPSFHHYALTGKDGLADGILSAVAGSNTEVLVGNQSGVACAVNPVTDSIAFTTGWKSKNPVEKIIYDRFKDRFFIIRSTTSIYKKGKEKLLYSCSQADILPVGKDSIVVLIGRENCKSRLKGIKLVENTLFSGSEARTLLSKNRVTSYLLTDSGKIFLGTVNGIFELFNNEMIHLGTTNELLGIRIVELIATKNNNFCMVTRGKGLVFYNDGKPHNVSEADGLLSNQLTTGFLDNDNAIWVGSSEGVNIINEDGSIISITRYNGLISNEIHDIYVSENKAYIATKKGLTILDLNHISREVYDIPVYFNEIKLSDSLLFPDVANKITIPYHSPILDLSYSGISYTQANKIIYKYRLNSTDNWQYSSRRNLVFSNLPSGNYTLEIYASADGKNWSTHQAILNIEVRYPVLEYIWL